MNAIDQLTAEHFAPLIGKVFRVVGSDLELTLTTLDQRERAGWGAMTRKPFALILRGPPDPILSEGPHRLDIDSGLTLMLYVIPIFTAAPDHQDYQIVFN
jgi:hypothetical protein